MPLVLKVPPIPTIVLFVGIFFYLLALLLVHAPFYAQVMWPVPDRNPTNTGAPNGPVPGQSFPRPSPSPQCVNVSPSRVAYVYDNNPFIGNRSCIPGPTGDDECRWWNKDCGSYCERFSSNGPIQGWCVNGTQNSCDPSVYDGPYDRVCLIDRYYVPSRYIYPLGRSPATEVQRAQDVMWYYATQNGDNQVTYLGGLDYWLIARLTTPVYLLMVIPYTGAVWTGALQMLLYLFAGLVALINTIQSFLWMWILTTIAGSMIRPAANDIGDQSWVFSGASLVVSGQWFMVIGQTIFLVLITRMFRAQHVRDGYIPVA